LRIKAGESKMSEKGLWKLRPLMKTTHSIVKAIGFKVKSFEQLEKEANKKEEKK
jgi:hypothetical protein